MIRDSTPLPGGPDKPRTLPPHVIEALKRGDMVEAIKIIRSTTDMSLAEVKAIVEDVQRQMPQGEAASHLVRGRQGLAPGEVSRGGGTGKWVALLALAALAIGAGLFFR